jgi:hypothetical protein
VENVDAERIDPEPLANEPVRRRSNPTPRAEGAVRLPIAGPYRPWARLVRDPTTGALGWRVRLWEGDRAVVRYVPTETLRAYARANRLIALAAAIDALIARAEEAP